MPQGGSLVGLLVGRLQQEPPACPAAQSSPAVRKWWHQLAHLIVALAPEVAPLDVAVLDRCSALPAPHSGRAPTPGHCPGDNAVSSFSSCLTLLLPEASLSVSRRQNECCRPPGGRAASERDEGTSCWNSSDPFALGSLESRVCSASLSIQSLGIIATSLCVQYFCCWDLYTHISCHIISSQLGTDRQKQRKDTQIVRHMEKVGRKRFILCTFVEHRLHLMDTSTCTSF